MAQAKKGDMVKVHYSGRLGTGVIFDTSEGFEPLQFKIGEGDLIQGFEEAVVGMSPGQSKTVEIPPEKGYGLYREDRVFQMDRKDLPEDIIPAEGMTLEVCASNGVNVPVQITDIAGDTITLDANHPLCEQTLIFDIQLLEIVEPGKTEGQ
ncbi:MAG TPA: peptidylprolyl isomerase [Methanothrix sp.]|nr:peptidylprolyl isomerase [Methanothrix sp.]HQE97623.1 peptidylprolyl isomerase [Methanothrix sp.]HQJ79709.1 peptidylprolyl isomerase [Methanothrix sp.]HUM80530.1 peptidylprolyl isomerase [Methanothrix sp.]